uniref:G_PROTEIN_RECEP_F1_2 domain-containing protein n=1 Tax=Macrostomum lignano TaxID=282301 RepID=A0A1I8GEA7_9PLAT
MTANDTVTELETAFEHLPALIDSDPIVFYPYVSLTSLAMVIGFLGNIAIFITLLARPDVQKVGREFMANMCLADLCVTGLADPLCIVAAIKGEKYLTERPELCTLVASLCLTACFCAFFSLGCITASRTVFICHNRMYKSLFSRRKAIVQCCLCWVLSLTAEAGNFLGWGGHFYDRKSESCAWQRTASSSYTFFVGVGLISFPLTLMLAANIKVLVKVHSTKLRLLAAVTSHLDKPTPRPS